MTEQRTPEDSKAELSVIDQAHIQNEHGRDAFLALAHTALFAASIAFVSGLGGGDGTRWIYLLLLGWLASVVGLVALTCSFHEAERHINRRRQQIYDDAVDEAKLARFLNGVALWSFPVALISTFVFAAVNILTV